jgi:hypothetical protein
MGRDREQGRLEAYEPMSHPLRFKPVNPAHDMVFSADGGWVAYEDYARIKSLCDNLGMGGKHTITQIDDENARLKAEVEKWKSWAEAENAEKKVIKAEVERLTFVDDFIVITRASIKQLIEEGVQNKSGEYEERYLIRVNKDEYIKVLKHMSEFWNAAKEGKESK